MQQTVSYDKFAGQGISSILNISKHIFLVAFCLTCCYFKMFCQQHPVKFEVCVNCLVYHCNSRLGFAFF